MSKSTGRIIADEGTAVFTGGCLCIVRNGEFIHGVSYNYGQGADEAVIDSSGQTVVYSFFPASDAPRVLRIYRPVLPVRLT